MSHNHTFFHYTENTEFCGQRLNAPFPYRQRTKTNDSCKVNCMISSSSFSSPLHFFLIHLSERRLTFHVRKSLTNSEKRHRELQNSDFHSFLLIPIITMPTKRRNEQNCRATFYSEALEFNEQRYLGTFELYSVRASLNSILSYFKYSRRKRSNKLQSLDDCIPSV